ncbi:hypothetical protein TNCV_1813371 [Trichonephila clavipes]|uniref:Uncharacterized protein n=1 Tax=Trichonephila clavipes TaxID=2585209 RepID=A0A8X7BFT6_TRICX|nr:hypothetical protein TNCV_1813371 [Trichonephila clavipes]
MVLTKENKHRFSGGLLVDDTSSDLALPSSIFKCIEFIGQRHGHHRGRTVLGEGINRVHDEVFKAPLAFIRFKQDAIQQGSRGVFKCVRHSTTMDERSNLECGKKILGVKKF